MIFKTFDSDVDNMSTKWGMFGKSFSDIGNTISTKWKQVNDYIAVTNDATLSGIANAWKGSKPLQFLETSQVENILNEYNKALDQGAEATAKFIDAGTGNDFMNGFLKDLNGAPATMDKYNTAVKSAEVSQKGLTASMIASKIAAMALNMAVSMGISIAISALAKVVDDLVHANERAIESAEELRNKYNEFKETNASNVQTLNDLKSEFEDLSKGVSQYGDNISLTTDQYERYKEIVQQIVGMSPSLAEGYSTENGYIADKNGLLERAIELQEIEYRNELRKITNLDNLKTSMSGYIAEYKEAFNGGLVTENGSATATREFTDLQNSIYELFNTNNRENFSSEDMIKQIMESLGIQDIEKEMAKYYNEYGYFQSTDFWRDYADIIAQNIQVIDDSLTAESVGLDETVFDQNIEKVESAAEAYKDMKDAISMANESIQTDLGYIAEYADGYSDLTTEQQKFVSEYLKGFDISDITSTNYFGELVYDEDKMASVKSQIKKFVEQLSQDETIKKYLTNLYSAPTDEQSVSDYATQITTALEKIKKYCEEHEIAIPLSIGDIEENANSLQTKYNNAVQSAKDKFGDDDFDWDSWFKENSVNTQEEIDRWLEIANAANSAAEARKKYVEGETTSDKTSISYESLAESAEEATDTVSTLRNSISDLNDAFAEQAENGSISVDTMLKLVEAGYATALQFDETTGACIINKDAMLDLVKAKIENQIADLESLQTDIASKLKEDGLIASESAKGFLALAEAKKAAATAEQLASVQDYNEAAAQIKALKNSLQNIDKISSGTYSSKAPSSSASSSKSSSDPYKEAFTKEYNTLKHNLEMEYITEKQYYDSLSELNNKYFAGKSQYLDEYRQYEEEVYKGLQSYYKDYVESSMDLLEKQLDVGVINYQHYSSTVKSLLDNMYSDEKISAEDYFSYVETMLNKQLDIYKAALSGVTSLLDSEIDKWEEKIDALNEQNDLLEKQKDDYDAILSAVDDVYQSEIDKLEEQKDLLQDKIDAINDANDALDLQKRKQEALYALERAKNQRTIKLYADGQYIYTQDYDEIREAQDNLKDIENEEIIKKLEEEQDALDKSIELLESYRELWGQISDAYDQEINKQLAVALWGENYESLILQNRISDIESFKSNYISIQEQINDNTSLIESYEQKVEYYSRLKDQWNSISDEYENNMNRQYAAQLLGANWEVDVLSGRLDVLNNFRNQYVALQQAIADTAWNSANSQIAAYNAVKEAEVTKAQTSGGTSGNVGSSSTSSNVTNTVDKPKVSTSGASGGKNFNQAILRYGTGTDNAKKGLNLVGEDGAEVYIDNDDNASIVTEPTLIPMEGGETVIKSSETEKILKSIRKLIPLENIVLGKSEATLPFDLEDFSKRLQSFAPSYSSMFHMPNMQISNLDFVPAQDRTTPVVQHVTLTLPNVTNNSGYERIKKELYQMQIDAYQFAHRR